MSELKETLRFSTALPSSRLEAQARREGPTPRSQGTSRLGPRGGPKCRSSLFRLARSPTGQGTRSRPQGSTLQRQRRRLDARPDPDGPLERGMWSSPSTGTGVRSPVVAVDVVPRPVTEVNPWMKWIRLSVFTSRSIRPSISLSLSTYIYLYLCISISIDRYLLFFSISQTKVNIR